MSRAGMKVIAPVVALIVAVPSAAEGTVASANVNGPVPVGVAGVIVIASLAGVVPLRSIVVGGVGNPTLRSMLAGALTSASPSVTSYVKSGTLPWNPAAGVKVITPVLTFIVATPSAAEGVVTR